MKHEESISFAQIWTGEGSPVGPKKYYDALVFLSPFWILCIQWSGDTGKAGERDDNKSHFFAQQGEKRLLQRSMPHV